MSRSVFLLMASVAMIGAIGVSRMAAAAPTLGPGDGNKIVAPKIPGLDITVGQTVLIQPGEWYPVVFQFADGRISVGSGNYNPKAGKWSSDGGRTWRDGPAAPDEASIELGGGEVLSLGFHTKKRPDGKYSLPQRRSLDGWKTVQEETSVLDIPHTIPCGGDGEGMNEGFLMDHGVLRLKDGRLMATMYGNYDDDKTPPVGYPPSMLPRQYRTIVAFSSDKGKTWGNPVTVAAAPMCAVTRVGPCEADLARAANGDILCAMRSGGQPGASSSPCYLSRSADEGQTWSKPQAILKDGVWPNLCLMQNGIIVCVTGRPGNWLVFSKDDGHTWQGGFCFYQGEYGVTSSYNTVLEVAPDTILVIYDRKPVDKPGALPHEIVGTFFTVRKKASQP
jgi:hypothetical protein